MADFGQMNAAVSLETGTKIANVGGGGGGQRRMLVVNEGKRIVEQSK